MYPFRQAVMGRTGRGGERPHCAEIRHLRAANSAASRTLPRADGTITRESNSTGPATPELAWFSVELLGYLPDGLNRLLPVDIGRFRYRSDFVARHSG